MTIEEINEVVDSFQKKIDEIKLVVSDIAACQSERSKTILIAAASKLVEPLKTQASK